MDVICPRIGTVCITHECEFYDKVPSRDEFVCRDKLRNLYLDDITRYLHDILMTDEQHRELQTQAYKSAMLKKATPEFLRLIDNSNEG